MILHDKEGISPGGICRYSECCNLRAQAAKSREKERMKSVKAEPRKHELVGISYLFFLHFWLLLIWDYFLVLVLENTWQYFVRIISIEIEVIEIDISVRVYYGFVHMLLCN